MSVLCLISYPKKYKIQGGTLGIFFVVLSFGGKIISRTLPPKTAEIHLKSGGFSVLGGGVPSGRSEVAGESPGRLRYDFLMILEGFWSPFGDSF